MAEMHDKNVDIWHPPSWWYTVVIWGSQILGIGLLFSLRFAVDDPISMLWLFCGGTVAIVFGTVETLRLGIIAPVHLIAILVFGLGGLVVIVVFSPILIPFKLWENWMERRSTKLHIDSVDRPSNEINSPSTTELDR
jgi:hypothetical protein